MFNKVSLIGKICNEVELKGEKQNFLVLNIAVRNNFKTDGEYKYEFIPVKAFNKKAEFVNNYYNKGDYVKIEARLKMNERTINEKDYHFLEVMMIEIDRLPHANKQE